MIRVVLADDHPIVRQGLRTLLESECGCQVVGEAADGLTAVDLISRLTPDVAILDLQMPDLDGLEVARRAREKAPTTRVIILSMHGDEPYVVQALRHGVAGYVLKGAATTDLITAVRTVMAGKRFLSAALSERAIEAYALRAQEASSPLDRYELLTAREREVLATGCPGYDQYRDWTAAGDQPAHRGNPPHQPAAQADVDNPHRARALCHQPRSPPGDAVDRHPIRRMPRTRSIERDLRGDLPKIAGYSG